MDNHQQSLWEFMYLQSDKLLSQIVQHLGLTFASLLLAIAIGIPFGIIIARHRKWSPIVLGIAGILQTIPSIALLGFMIPIFGIGANPAIIVLLIYALLPIIRNTYTGIIGINPDVIEASKAMGMTQRQTLMRITLPLAMPIILAGVRTATVINVGVATLASLIAAGGLGEFIFGGISLNNSNMIMAGAIPAAILAIVLDALLSFMQRLNLMLLKRILYGFCLVVISTLGWLSLPKEKAGELLAGFTPEFMGRSDGDIGLKSIYGLKIKTTVISDAVMYKAVYEKEIDVISGYSTDGRLKAYGLVVLTDDKGIFPPYHAAPIISNAALLRFPDLEGVLNQLSGKISDSTMTELNYRTDYLKQTPERVAKDFLKGVGLYKRSLNSRKATVRIGSKIFGEQYILAQIYRMLIEGNTSYSVETKTGLGGTKICFDALINDEIDFYPEYTGTGFLVILQPKQDVINAVGNDRDKVYTYVKEKFLSTYQIKWLKPIGFNNSYSLMMRQEQANQLGLNTISDLKNYLDK